MQKTIRWEFHPTTSIERFKKYFFLHLEQCWKMELDKIFVELARFFNIKNFLNIQTS